MGFGRFPLMYITTIFQKRYFIYIFCITCYIIGIACLVLKINSPNSPVDKTKRDNHGINKNSSLTDKILESGFLLRLSKLFSDVQNNKTVSKENGNTISSNKDKMNLSLFPHVMIAYTQTEKKNKKHSENADTSTSVTLTLSCDLDLKSKSEKHMSLDVAYCIVPWYQV